MQGTIARSAVFRAPGFRLSRYRPSRCSTVVFCNLNMLTPHMVCRWSYIFVYSGLCLDRPAIPYPYYPLLRSLFAVWTLHPFLWYILCFSILHSAGYNQVLGSTSFGCHFTSTHPHSIDMIMFEDTFSSFSSLTLALWPSKTMKFIWVCNNNVGEFCTAFVCNNNIVDC